MHVDVQDARVWTKRAMRKETRYDLIVLDAFNGDYIPEHLTFRFMETSDGKEALRIETELKAGALGQKPLLNPGS